MNYDFPIEELHRWNKDELFYREYYEAAKQGKEDKVLAEFPADPEWKGFVQDPSTIDARKTEEMFFSSGRNVSIVKHPRYFPIFFHEHTFFEILFVISGQCRQLFHDSELPLTAGDYCMIAPGVTHAIKVFDDSVVLNILIRRSTFMDIFFNTVRNKSQIALFFLGSLYEKQKIPYMIYHTGADKRLRNYILDMYMEQVLPDEYSDRIMCSLLTIFFNQLTRRHGRMAEIPAGSGKKSEYADDIMNYIMRYYANTSIRDLANHFHFSEPYCSKLVREISGSTFSELQTSIRMNQAENMLTQTQMSVEDISYEIGYKNPETFIRSFKRIFQISPSQYRKNPDAAGRKVRL